MRQLFKKGLICLIFYLKIFKHTFKENWIKCFSIIAKDFVLIQLNSNCKKKSINILDIWTFPLVQHYWDRERRQSREEEEEEGRRVLTLVFQNKYGVFGVSIPPFRVLRCQTKEMEKLRRSRRNSRRRSAKSWRRRRRMGRTKRRRRRRIKRRRRWREQHVSTEWVN